MRILFLGAGKRLSLLEAFHRAALAEKLELQCHAVELATRVPIAGVARIHVGPAFLDPAFPAFLLDLVDRLRIDAVVPNMDSATLALSRLADPLQALGCWAVVSSSDLCAAMYDKAEADRWFRAAAIPVPGATTFPRIAKPRLGFGARGQAVLADQGEEDAFFTPPRDREAYQIQSFVQGPEFSVDAYVDRADRIIGLLSRKRLQVVDGEVEVSETWREPSVLTLCRQTLSWAGWRGPLTLQVIQGPQGPAMIEINPRFGGGVTHAIHCGLDMPRWIMRERLGLELAPRDEWLEHSVMTRCRRDVFHDPTC